MSEVKDPVCGKTLNPETAEHKSIYENKVYYFCSAEHQSEFNKNHGLFLQQSASDQRHAAHYGGYCNTPGCNKPSRGVAWYMYLALLFLVLLLLLFIR